MHPAIDELFMSFNPRSRVGSDMAISRMIGQHFTFQSTLPRRERHSKRGLSLAS